VLDRLRVLLVQPEGLGVPSAAITASDGTIGGTYFASNSQLGPFPSWGAACAEAESRAAATGYRIEYVDPFMPDDADGGEGSGDDDDDDDF
jgi:hypothetical protein